jgi:very-short-patch-repair endonuclease
MRRSLRHRRQLRRASTDAELVLWYHLRDRRLAGIKFRRQHPFGRFILDFFCEERRLAVELDGGQHFDAAKQRYDERRSAFIREYGITVIRFSNDQVMRERWAVLEEIARALGVAT